MLQGSQIKTHDVLCKMEKVDVEKYLWQVLQTCLFSQQIAYNLCISISLLCSPRLALICKMLYSTYLYASLVKINHRVHTWWCTFKTHSDVVDTIDDEISQLINMWYQRGARSDLTEMRPSGKSGGEKVNKMIYNVSCLTTTPGSNPYLSKKQAHLVTSSTSQLLSSSNVRALKASMT